MSNIDEFNELKKEVNKYGNVESNSTEIVTKKELNKANIDKNKGFIIIGMIIINIIIYCRGYYSEEIKTMTGVEKKIKYDRIVMVNIILLLISKILYSNYFK